MPKLADHIARSIDEYGFSTLGIFGGTPNFAYTIGFKEVHNLPDLVIIGLSPQMAHGFFWQLLEEMKTIRLKDPGYNFDCHVNDKLANFPMCLRTVDMWKAKDYVVQAILRADKLNYQCEYVQIVMTDKNSQFPWDEGYDREYMGSRQPELW